MESVSDLPNGANMAILAALAPAMGVSASISLHERLETAVAHFETFPRAVGLLVVDGPCVINAISREWIAEQLSRPFFRELFLRRPIRHLLQSYSLPALELPQDMGISQAIERALARPEQARYQPLIVIAPDSSRWLLDVYSLLLQQCLALQATLRNLEEQRLATEIAVSEREKLQQRLLTASRDAGRAEIATGILHNVGNVLNSVNVSVAMIHKAIQQSKMDNLAKSVALIDEHRDDLGAFFSGDERGQRLAGYLAKLTDVLGQEQKTISEELSGLGRNLEHIRQVVAMQQSYAKSSTVRELVRPSELVEDAIRVNLVSFERHNIQVDRQYADLPQVPLDKHKVLQILINLVSNARNAVKRQQARAKRITVKIECFDVEGAPRIRFQVTDNGVGIPPQNLTHIFTHGFTTRKEGHGFGLHGAANAAREMGGSLTGASGGIEQGATFTLDLPLHADAALAPAGEKAAA